MASQTQRRQLILNYLYNYTVFEPGEFDKNFTLIKDYALEYGFSGNDLELIAQVAFKQNLAGIRIRKVIFCLIPRAKVPEIVVRTVLRWLIQNHKKKATILAIKTVLQWLAGVVEYKLEENEVVNLYYYLFYSFLQRESLNVYACKLIFLLTKSTDVNRWLVKQVLKVHLKRHKPKFTGVLLYLFKSYRPECVPEHIPAYSLLNAFGSQAIDLKTGFTKARENIMQNKTIPYSIDSVWKTFDVTNSSKKKNIIYLIPKIPKTEGTRIYLDGYDGLVPIKKFEHLVKYHLSSCTPHLGLSLLNNSEGCFILQFADKIAHNRFNYQLYFLLNDAFLEHNPNVPYVEKDKFLEKISYFQLYLQQAIPMVSKFLANYLPKWDGYEHSEHIYRLLRWLHVSSYEELKTYILKYIYEMFVSSPLATKCDLLKTVVDMAINFMNTYYSRKIYNYPSPFYNIQPSWDGEEFLTKLYEYINELFIMGLNLEDDHSTLLYCILNLTHKICLVETEYKVKIWNFSNYIAYYALFSNNAYNLDIMYNLSQRFPDYIPSVIKQDFSDALINDMAFISDDGQIFQGFKLDSKFFRNSIPNCNEVYNWDRHFGRACYNYKTMIASSNPDYDINNDARQAFVEVRTNKKSARLK